MNRPSTASLILPSLPPNSRILILRLRSIGDIVLLTPALRLLKAWRPDVRVCVTIETRFRGVLENNPDVDEIFEAGEGSGWRLTIDRIRAVRALRQRHFDLCLNLHGGPTSALLTAWSGARVKCGFEHFRRRQIYDVLIPDARIILNQPAIHTAEHQASALFYLGLPRTEIPSARIVLTAAERSSWAEKRRKYGLAVGKDYAVIHPTALYATKQWASENFAALGAFIEKQFGLLAIYACGPGEESVLDAVERAAGLSIRRFSGADLRLYAAALADARLFVGNDTGPAHMAAALGRPGVVIFSSSSSRIWGPWRPQAPWRVVQNHFECNPCPGDRCYQFERPECILSVSLAQVCAGVEAVLSRAPTPAGG